MNLPLGQPLDQVLTGCPRKDIEIDVILHLYEMGAQTEALVEGALMALESRDTQLESIMYLLKSVTLDF